jgi:hypothetical protein
LIEEATVDAYGESEQATAFLTMLEECLALPFGATVLGVANRRFLHSCLTPGRRAIEEYRRLVADAIYPDPFSNRRVSVRAAAAIVEYRRSTGDASGTVDLMLTFVEAGTEQAADLGYGDETYFNALQIRLDAVVKEFDTLPADVRANVSTRLGRIQVRAHDVGWGFSDAVDELVHALDARAARAQPWPRNRATDGRPHPFMTRAKDAPLP